MMTIKTIGEPVLNKTAAQVEIFDEELLFFINEMIETMIVKKGIGLAAPQVGVLKRLFVCQIQDKEPLIFINPEIIFTSTEICTYEEGCLSIPGIYADVIRPENITVQAFNVNGKPFTLDAEGFLARVIQHENDHLNGKLFIEHLSERKRTKILKIYEKKKKI